LLGALSGLVVPLTAIASGPILARALGVEGRGEMASVLAPLFVAVFVFALGLPEAATWSLSTLRQPVGAVIRAMTPQLVVQSFAATAVMWAVAPFLLHQSPELVDEFRVASLALPLLIVALVQRYVWSGLGMYALVRRERAGGAVVRLIALAVLFAAGLLTVNVAVWTNIGTNVLMAVGLGALAVVYLRRGWSVPRAVASTGDREGGTVMRPGVLPRRSLRSMMAGYSIRGWGGALANLITWRMDQVILVPLISAASLGLYVVAVSLAEIPMMAVNTVRGFIQAESGRRSHDDVVAAMSRVVLLATLAFSAITVVAAEPFIVVLFGADFAGSVPLAQLLLIGVPLFAAEQVLGSGLLSMGRPGLRSLGQAIGAVVTLVGLLVFVPQYGVVVAAVTSAVAYSLTLMWTSLWFSRLSGIPLRRCLIPRWSDAVVLVSTSVSLLRRTVSRRRPAQQPDLDR
jgi:O-antigen/teichoic acid export membrane protein